MNVRASVLWKINTHTVKKWPEKVRQRSFIKEHSFVYRLYMYILISYFYFYFYTPDSVREFAHRYS